jgi:hypothetical protein
MPQKSAGASCFPTRRASAALATLRLPCYNHPRLCGPASATRTLFPDFERNFEIAKAAKAGVRRTASDL